MTPRTHLPDDWFGRGIPESVRVGADVYIDSSYGFDGVLAEQAESVVLGDATGAYDRAALLVGPRGRVVVGAYTVLNGCYLIAEDRISIGDHCLLAWGAVVTDTWAGRANVARRRDVLRNAHSLDSRWIASAVAPQPVHIDDNVWIGFDAVVMPGTSIGRGAVISSRSVVSGVIPPYAVVVGNPGRIVRSLHPDDSEAARQEALAEYLRTADD